MLVINKMPRAPSAKNWCFTINNYTDEEYQGVLRCLRSISKYFIIGKEVGDSGTPHLQGYCSLSISHSLSQLKDQLSSRGHFEVAKGGGAHNRVYCSKGNDFVEEGSCPGGTEIRTRPKNRDQLAGEWRLAFERGRSGISEFADANPGVYYWSRHTLLRNSLGHATAITRPDIHVRWFYGPPGAGKSRKAHEELPEAYIKEPRTKWWTGYLLEKDCIIDDFGPRGIDINHLLRWFDRYKCYVETKGDMVPLHVVNFIVTSNFHPESVFSENGEPHPQTSALMRRIVLEEFFN